MTPRSTLASMGAAQRRRVDVRGVVQGVGFRPFVHRLAVELGLAGMVGNDREGAFIEVEGEPAAIGRFLERLPGEAPDLARIEQVQVFDMSPRGVSGFEIVESAADGAPVRAPVPPDVAPCAACRAELFDPSDRRHRYPFINCTDCGPRYTIIHSLPYDRPATTMASFAMCDRCRAEYVDPVDRRHHAQPIACPACGPSLRFDSASGEATGDDAAIEATQAALRRAWTVAIKGIGGYHLACDASCDDAVHRLRVRKGRGDKPFAVMVRDLASARRLAVVDAAEAELLTSAARPIVLVQRRIDAPLSTAVAPGNPLLGLVLPYSPLHELLFEAVPGSSEQPPTALVMTSGNRSDEPIATREDDAVDRLAGIADAFLHHDRPIATPCDDSVVRVVAGTATPVRRSRGYAPLPIALPIDVVPTLGVGGELKNTFCLAAGRHAWVSQHLGDMENLETLEAFERAVDSFTRLHRVEPDVIAVDRHPRYQTRRWALDRLGGRRLVEVQHHHAHVASLMVEHGLDGAAPIIGVAFDGTGHGTAADGTVQAWGGEVLIADHRGFDRFAHLAPMPLPGVDEGIRNPCRTAVAYLCATGITLDRSIPAVAACNPTELSVVARQVERAVGCVATTSMGRLFDVVASLLGVRHRIGYEAQAAIELEALAATGRPGAVYLDFPLDERELDVGVLLGDLVGRLRSGVSAAILARSFHEVVARSIVAVARQARSATGLETVGLTGGVFQNALLTTLACSGLRAAGFEVLTHRFVPANDGGLALGQAIVAGTIAHPEGP